MAVDQSCFGSFDNINSFPVFKIRWIVHVLSVYKQLFLQAECACNPGLHPP